MFLIAAAAAASLNRFSTSSIASLPPLPQHPTISFPPPSAAYNPTLCSQSPPFQIQRALTNDYCATPQQLKDQLKGPDEGDFPFLSRPDEVNLHLQQVQAIGVKMMLSDCSLVHEVEEAVSFSSATMDFNWAWVGFAPSDRIRIPSSEGAILPLPSVSNNVNASFINETWSSLRSLPIISFGKIKIPGNASRTFLCPL
ncbi:hypothetical protein Q3G72_026504 [Acer saccharum]|nr:hypothetical protein Q3G72_026504 [Acer saccharum]